MSAVHQPSFSHVIPPAKYFAASATYDKWVKLTTSDVHALRQEPGFEGQSLYFHLNHPIRYIYLVAPVVGIEDCTANVVLLTLDDGSGACIDVKFTVKDASKVEAGASNTNIKNLSVERSLGTFDIVIDGRAIDIATVVKAKGTISTFRNIKQIELKRIEIVQGTNEEAKHWKAVAEFRDDVLSKPWMLTAEDRGTIDRKRTDDERVAREADRRENGRRRAKDERRAQREEKIKQHELRAEQRRLDAEKKLNAGALPNSDMIWEYCR